MAENNETVEPDPSKNKSERRKIPGNLPYTASPGPLKRALDKIPTTEKPSVFNVDFLGTVLQITGGSARPIPPLLKAAGLISAGGVPTELYAQFQTENGRATAALQALRSAYGEIFRRNQFAHKADEKALTDIVVAITGLPRNDNIVRSILSTFQVFQFFAKDAKTAENQSSDNTDRENTPEVKLTNGNLPNIGGGVGLIYNINVVLPETTNIDVYNAIFKSIRGNLLS